MAQNAFGNTRMEDEKCNFLKIDFKDDSKNYRPGSLPLRCLEWLKI